MSITVRSNEVTPPSQPAETQGQGQSLANLSAPGESTPGQKQSEESEASESEAVDTEQDESADDSDQSEGSEDQDDESKDAEKDKPKKKGGFQRRIDKLNQRHQAAQQELEYWKQMAMKDRAESKTEPKADKPQEAAEGRPDPDKFTTHAEYVEAVAEWKADQKFKERDRKSEQDKLAAAQQSLMNSHHERVKSFSAKVEDFSDALSDVDHIPVSAAVQELIVSSENGPALMYELAKNPDEYARICKLSPLAAAREMGKVEARLAAQSSGETKIEAKKITKAPKPIGPVGTGGKGTAAKSIFDPGLSQADYERLRSEQLKKRQG